MRSRISVIVDSSELALVKLWYTDDGDFTLEFIFTGCLTDWINLAIIS